MVFLGDLKTPKEHFEINWPLKCRAYIENLTPCLAKIAQTRKEEAVHETLAENMNSILDCLGHYASDNEIDQLLNAFLINLTESSASIR